MVGTSMKILPLRDMILVRFQEHGHPKGLVMVHEPKAVRPALVVAIGPEVRDIQEGQVVLVNQVTGTVIGGEFLVAEPNILGVLPMPSRNLVQRSK